MDKYKICQVKEGSIAEEMGIEAGDYLLEVNGEIPTDIFDYHYQVDEEELVLLIEKADGEQWELEIEKEYQEDVGLVFEQALLDEYHSCRNKCIFCFIDQMPPGMRETLYFKDDDARLSFLQGNFITLTNMDDQDLDRIIKYHLAPINISVHTTNPELRCKMLHNRFAGDVLEKIGRLYEAQIPMNCQVVLCKGWNDGEELDRTMSDMAEFYPYMETVTVVPFGKTKYREDLTPIEKFNKAESKAVLDQIHAFRKQCVEKFGAGFVQASDEWYLVAEEPVPDAEYYNGYGQLEDGVGIVRSFVDEVDQALEHFPGKAMNLKISMVTGVLSAPVVNQKMREVEQHFPGLDIQVHTIINHFFGEEITVTGLLTGQDIIEQLRGKDLGAFLVLQEVLLRDGTNVLLDDLTVEDIERELGCPVIVTDSNGYSLIETVLNMNGGKA